MENASSNISTDLDDETLHNARLLREASRRGTVDGGTVDEVKSLIEKLGRKNLDLTDNYFNTRTELEKEGYTAHPSSVKEIESSIYTIFKETV